MAAAPSRRANTAAPQTNEEKKTTVRMAKIKAKAPKASDPIPVPNETHFIQSEPPTGATLGLKTSLRIVFIFLIKGELLEFGRTEHFLHLHALFLLQRQWFGHACLGGENRFFLH